MAPELIWPQLLPHVLSDPPFVLCVAELPPLSGNVPQAGLFEANMFAMLGVVSGMATAPDATLPPGKLDARYFKAFALLLSTPEGATDIV